jgi:hypothetical protein
MEQDVREPHGLDDLQALLDVSVLDQRDEDQDFVWEVRDVTHLDQDTVLVLSSADLQLFDYEEVSQERTVSIEDHVRVETVLAVEEHVEIVSVTDSPTPPPSPSWQQQFNQYYLSASGNLNHAVNQSQYLAVSSGPYIALSLAVVLLVYIVQKLCFNSSQSIQNNKKKSHGSSESALRLTPNSLQSAIETLRSLQFPSEETPYYLYLHNISTLCSTICEELRIGQWVVEERAQLKQIRSILAQVAQSAKGKQRQRQAALACRTFVEKCFSSDILKEDLQHCHSERGLELWTQSLKELLEASELSEAFHLHALVDQCNQLLAAESIDGSSGNGVVEDSDRLDRMNYLRMMLRELSAAVSTGPLVQQLDDSIRNIRAKRLHRRLQQYYQLHCLHTSSTASILHVEHSKQTVEETTVVSATSTSTSTDVSVDESEALTIVPLAVSRMVPVGNSEPLAHWLAAQSTFESECERADSEHRSRARQDWNQICNTYRQRRALVESEVLRRKHQHLQELQRPSPDLKEQLDAQLRWEAWLWDFLSLCTALLSATVFLLRYEVCGRSRSPTWRSLLSDCGVEIAIALSEALQIRMAESTDNIVSNAKQLVDLFVFSPSFYVRSLAALTVSPLTQLATAALGQRYFAVVCCAFLIYVRFLPAILTSQLLQLLGVHAVVGSALSALVSIYCYSGVLNTLFSGTLWRITLLLLVLLLARQSLRIAQSLQCSVPRIGGLCAATSALSIAAAFVLSDAQAVYM